MLSMPCHLDRTSLNFCESTFDYSFQAESISHFSVWATQYFASKVPPLNISRVQNMEPLFIFRWIKVQVCVVESKPLIFQLNQPTTTSVPRAWIWYGIGLEMHHQLKASSFYPKLIMVTCIYGWVDESTPNTFVPLCTSSIKVVLPRLKLQE